ncbi:hypothetical protein A3A39_03435 [Candidatus Kaiserbacteria bacterium RIFCSPLOWO2_01_FULL_54_13]|uniref:Ig-like domain-containing protein n=1 Tax=Candidatus Kaiserbacteria bacterium RIFCSPLOWO2_01_FULL_54_13 TaxID=1798512 RepID=A0A1F6F370_9BACT|nr:MAG: hypothetical protein A3A39_03435 [Candidatus Kaiserbacteria bacterium RIFCSPLOWO2_01_FULL_54_13]
MGSIPPLSANGSASVSPSQTTTYTYSGQYRLFGFPTDSFSCSAVVTVGGAASCTAQYYCSGNDLYYRESSCTTRFIERCSYLCSGGACVPAPVPTGDITVSPALVRLGETTKVTWVTANVTSCTVTAGNGDSWSGLSSPAGGQTTRQIVTATIYTLSCTGPGGNLTDTATVNILPVFQEI